MAGLKFIALFTLSDGSNWNQEGSFDVPAALCTFVVAKRHFHAAGWNFEEILQHLNKKH